MAAIARDAAERIFSRLAKCEAEEVEDMDVGLLIRCLVEGKSKGFLGKGDCRIKYYISLPSIISILKKTCLVGNLL